MQNGRRPAFTLPKRIVIEDINTKCFKVHGNTLIQEPLPSVIFKATPILENRLFLGDVNDAKNVEALRKEGITHIISCCPERREMIPEVEGICYLYVDVADKIGQDISSYFDVTFKFIENALRESEFTKVLVHCASGISRSATIVISFLMRFFCIGSCVASEAVAEMREKVCPNIGFCLQLCDYERSFL